MKTNHIIFTHELKTQRSNPCKKNDIYSLNETNASEFGIKSTANTEKTVKIGKFHTPQPYEARAYEAPKNSQKIFNVIYVYRERDRVTSDGLVALCLTECKANFATEFILHILNVFYALCFMLCWQWFGFYFFFFLYEILRFYEIFFVCWFCSVLFVVVLFFFFIRRVNRM